jgi:hypothetical protein
MCFSYRVRKRMPLVILFYERFNVMNITKIVKRLVIVNNSVSVHQHRTCFVFGL